MPPGAPARSAAAASLDAKRPSSSSQKTPAATSARRTRRSCDARAPTASRDGLGSQRLRRRARRPHPASPRRTAPARADSPARSASRSARRDPPLHLSSAAVPGSAAPTDEANANACRSPALSPSSSERETRLVATFQDPSGNTIYVTDQSTEAGLPMRALVRPPQPRIAWGSCLCSGGGGIRTLGAGVTHTTVFETARFNHSRTPPGVRSGRLASQRRRAAKKSTSSAAHSGCSTPPMTTGRWFRRGSARMSRTLPAAPALGSAVP